uniref:Transcription factor CP2-like 1 n=1 Tax=Kryptolebias marmoratus TaxID=37003 RepID=A0A3Q3A4X2_KRYMA
SSYIPLSVGILEPHADPLHLNTIEFLWDPQKNASVFIQVNCISTEFTPRKHGGEKGVPFRIQVDSFTINNHGEYVEHVHSSSCQVKVFKPKGADRKLKTDREKMDKKSPQDRDKYQPSYETTLLKECSPWPDAISLTNHSSTISTRTHLLPSSSPQDTQQWLHRHRFAPFSRLFSSFSGADLLRMSREDLIQICGPADGIRLFNTMKRKRCSCSHRPEQEVKHSLSCNIYHALYLEERTLMDLSEKIAVLYNITPQQITQIYRQKTTGIHILVSNEVRDLLTCSRNYENSDGYHVVLK